MDLRPFDDVDYYYVWSHRVCPYRDTKVYYMARRPKVGAEDGTHTKVYPSYLVKRNDEYWWRISRRTNRRND